jgi:hypothetical protein
VRSVLEIDPFGAPTASKIYLTYTNNASKPVVAVKFRCRFSDETGKDRGTFHAPDSAHVPPGGSRSHKWKREGGLYPNLAGFQIRVLQVKYGDGSVWHSAKMQELIDSQDGNGGSFGSPGEQPQQPPVQQPPQDIGSQPYLQSPQSNYDPGQHSESQGQQQPPYQQSPQQEQTGGYDRSKELPW